MENTIKNNRDEAVLTEQFAFMERVREILLSRYKNPPKAFVHTYGCQQNVSDSERMQGLLRDMGYEFCDSPDEADLVLFNTCAVREHAEDRVWGNIGVLKKYKKARPDMIIAVCGCMTQQTKNADRLRRSFPYVDLVFGTYSRWKLPEFLYKRLTGGPRVFHLEENEQDIKEGFPVKRDGTFKAWIPIMYGCNNFCTYCIVPYVRGRERSRAPEDILNEVKEVVAKGCREITLLGQNVNSYGKGESHGINFAKLLRLINEIDGDFRIRFMTSHPRDCTEELLDAMRDCEKVCRHLHLPVQSGSDRILKEMNRHYGREDYMKLVEGAKERMPVVELTSDIIVGFPGETYEDFSDTVSLIKQVEYQSLFTFIYSPRTGTPAAEMPDPISREEKGKWFSELLKVQEEIGDKITASHVGRTYRVLCEDEGRQDGYIAGRTDGNTVIEFEGDKSLIGNFVTVKVNSLSSVLEGEIINNN